MEHFISTTILVHLITIFVCLDIILSSDVMQVGSENSGDQWAHEYPRPTKEPGYPRPTKEPGYPRPTKEPGYPRPTKEPGYPRPTKEPGYPRPTKEPGYLRPTKEPGYPRPTKEPGYPRPTKEPGYPRPTKEPGYPRPTKEPGYPRRTKEPGLSPSPQHNFVWVGTPQLITRASNADECSSRCLKNLRCQAYTYTNIPPYGSCEQFYRLDLPKRYVPHTGYYSGTHKKPHAELI